MTIEQLAEAAGVTRQTVGNIENGHKAPRLDTAHVIAHALRIPLSDLVKVL
ncbi:HTH cro/C1-type domain-containing protein [Dermacoccus barathri]